jgi:hypothetical protein
MAERTDTELTAPRQFADGQRIVEQAAPANTCCGGPAPQGTNACCVRDADAKSTGAAGCGCGPTPAVAAKKTGCCG